MQMEILLPFGNSILPNGSIKKYTLCKKEKTTEVTILISDKTEFKTKAIVRDK